MLKGKILNTNSGVGFTRGRKYDTDLDRLGRIDTAQGELRKTRDLNLQKELKKTMATYSIKRFSQISQREYGLGDVVGAVGDGVREAAGSTIEGAGKLLDNGIAKTGAGIAGLGMMGTGASVGSAVGSVFGPLGSLIGGALGAIATPVATAKLTGAVGKGLKTMGSEIRPGGQ